MFGNFSTYPKNINDHNDRNLERIKEEPSRLTDRFVYGGLLDHHLPREKVNCGLWKFVRGQYVPVKDIDKREDKD